MKKILLLLLAILPFTILGLSFDAGKFYFIVLSEEEATVTLWGVHPQRTDTLLIPETVSYKDKTYTVTEIGCPEVLNDDPHYPAGALGVKVVVLPASIQKTEPFWGQCLEEIIVDENNQWLSSHDGVLYSKDCKTLYLCPRLNRFTAFQPGVERIGREAFGGCLYITSSELPNTVYMIGEYAFSCSKLCNITLPEGLETIPVGCFSQCEQLTTVSLPKSLKYIEGFAFYTDKKIETIYCRAEQTPSYDTPHFAEQIYTNAILYVPVGSLDSYQTTPPWSMFKNIKEYDYSSNTPVEDTGINIRAEGGAIVVSGNEAAPVEVYRADGTLVRRTYDARIDGLPRGLYIVKVADTIKKISL